MTQISTTGKVASQPEQREYGKGKSMSRCRFTVEMKDSPWRIWLAAFNEGARAYLMSLDDGQAVEVAGKLTMSTFQTDSGKKSTFSIVLQGAPQTEEQT